MKRFFFVWASGGEAMAGDWSERQHHATPDKPRPPADVNYTFFHLRTGGVRASLAGRWLVLSGSVCVGTHKARCVNCVPTGLVRWMPLVVCHTTPPAPGECWLFCKYKIGFRFQNLLLNTILSEFSHEFIINLISPWLRFSWEFSSFFLFFHRPFAFYRALSLEIFRNLCCLSRSITIY